MKNHKAVAGMSVLGVVSHLLPRGSTVAIVSKAIARIFAIFLGIVLFTPAAMMSDSGTPQAIRASQTQLTACLLIFLSGIFGNVNVFALAVLTLLLSVLAYEAPVAFSKVYLCVIVPVAFIWILGCQFQVLPSAYDIYIRRHEATSNVTTEYVLIHDNKSGGEDLDHHKQ